MRKTGKLYSAVCIEAIMNPRMPLQIESILSLSNSLRPESLCHQSLHFHLNEFETSGGSNGGISGGNGDGSGGNGGGGAV